MSKLYFNSINFIPNLLYNNILNKTFELCPVCTSRMSMMGLIPSHQL